MSKNLYGSDDSLITGGIIYDETEETTQDLINAEQKKAGVYYCTCSTAAATQKKTVTISGITSLYDGLKIRVRFTNEQGFNGVPTLDVNSLGAWPINRDSNGMAVQHEWTGGEVLDLTYDASLQRWIIVGGERATEGHYGKTKLFTSVLSPSTTMAATPASVKTVNDKVGDGVLDASFEATDLTEAANELKNTLTQLETETETVENGLAIVVVGDSSASGASIGQYVYLKDSTITGYADGLYTAAQAIPANTAIDGTYLTAVTGGGLNSLNDKINNVTLKRRSISGTTDTNGNFLTDISVVTTAIVCVSCSNTPDVIVSAFSLRNLNVFFWNLNCKTWQGNAVASTNLTFDIWYTDTANSIT